MENLGEHCPRVLSLGSVLELILGHRSDSQCTSCESRWSFDLPSLLNPPISLMAVKDNLMPGQLGQGLALATAQLSLAPLPSPGAFFFFFLSSFSWTSPLFVGDAGFV